MQKTALFFDEKNILFDKKMIFSQKVARIVRYFFYFFGYCLPLKYLYINARNALLKEKNELDR